MRFTGQSFVQLALGSLALLPSFISAQETHSISRSYFSPVLLGDRIYMMGGSDTTLNALFINLTNGIDINNKVDWTYHNTPVTAELLPYGRGVAYAGLNNEIFIQGGNGSTDAMENIVKFFPFKDGQWQKAQSFNTRPPVTNYMSASMDSTTGIAYYYGGQPLKNHEPDLQQVALNTFSTYNTVTGIWNVLTPNAPNATRPGRIGHTSTFINNQIFIMGGRTSTKANDFVPADLNSVLVYDIDTNTAVSVQTLGDIPPSRQSHSAALGLDGHSIVIYGGVLYPDPNNGNFTAAKDDGVYILDTCTLTWRLQKVGGTSPGPLFAHGAITVNDYMVVTLGKSSQSTFSDNTYLLDLNSWKWVNSLSNTGNTVAASSCKFNSTAISFTNFVPYNYDASILANPNANQKQEINKKGFGIGFGLFAVILIAGIGAFFYMRRVRRKRSRTLNPRWMRNVPSQTNNTLNNDRDYPLFVYNKELDSDNTNNPNRTSNAFAPNGVRTYTASDHEQWESQLNKEPSSDRHSDIWQRMRGLNDTPTTNTNEEQQHRTGKLLDV